MDIGGFAKSDAIEDHWEIFQRHYWNVAFHRTRLEGICRLCIQYVKTTIIDRLEMFNNGLNM